MSLAIGVGEHGYRLPPRHELYSGPLRRLPRWAKMWTKRKVLFSYNGVVYRIVLEGSHNNTPERSRWSFMTKRERRSCNRKYPCGMFVEYVRAVPSEEETIELAGAGTPMKDFAASLMAVQSQGMVFTPDMLRDAKHLKWYRQ